MKHFHDYLGPTIIWNFGSRVRQSWSVEFGNHNCSFYEWNKWCKSTQIGNRSRSTHRVCLAASQHRDTSSAARSSWEIGIVRVLKLNLASTGVHSASKRRSATTWRERSKRRAAKVALSPSNSYYFQFFTSSTLLFSFFGSLVDIFCQLWRRRRAAVESSVSGFPRIHCFSCDGSDCDEVVNALSSRRPSQIQDEVQFRHSGDFAAYTATVWRKV